MFRFAPFIIFLIGLGWWNWATAEGGVDYCAKDGTLVTLLLDSYDAI